MHVYLQVIHSCNGKLLLASVVSALLTPMPSKNKSKNLLAPSQASLEIIPVMLFKTLAATFSS